MSNKAETMKKNSKRTLTPKLRFPEFRDKEEWVEKVLSGTCLMQAGKFVAASDINYQEEEGLFPCYGGNGLRGFTKSRTHNGVYPLIGRQGALCGNVRLAQGEFYATEHAVVATPMKGVDVLWLFYMLDRLNLNRFATGQAQPGLSVDVLEKVNLAVPALEQEQNRIAECLGSLDGLIAAEGRKLAALRDHKRGLMQQLFPKPGQTQPRLRFPEFRDKGEWVECELGPMTTKVGSGITPRGGDKNYRKDGRAFVRSQNVGWGVLILEDVVYIEEETHSSFDATEIKENDVLLNITGASIGRSAVADSRLVGGNVNQHVCIIRTEPKRLYPFLLNQYLISEYGQTQIDSFQAGGNRQGLNFAQIRSFVIPMPPTKAEQQKIADCLCSLDTQIRAQAEKIEVLKTHKRGLMQQLFPAPEEQ